MFVRTTLLAGALLGTPLLSAPPLTTVQDVLYRADGTRFNGTLQINWNSFEASDTSNVTMQSLTVRVVEGGLHVQLVPNAGAGPNAYYTVRYNSDGKVQFQETWAVPQSPTPLRVREVRVSSPPTPQAPSTAIQENDVVGLLADLVTRPLKGAGYAPGRIAFIDGAGLLESVTGNPADCVHVDGSSGPCGDPNPPAFADAEMPGGIVDGANVSFTLASAPNPPSSLAVFRNGILQKAGQDYSLFNNTVQFVPAAAPQPGDTLLAWYRLAGVARSSAMLASTAARRAAVASVPVEGPQVLCAGTGAGAAQASCPIAARTLNAGDRVEVRFDYARAGTAGSFSWEVRWGSLTVASGNPSDTLLTGRLDAGVYEGGTQWSWQTWGASAPAAGGVADAPGTPATSIDFRGDGATLRNFTVLRYPKK
jgi:hypothetical protein